MPIDPDNTQTSRSRLLAAGKSLFGRHGYEQTSTAMIARKAGTSESQLVRYFGGKSGLLEAIFNEGWGAISKAVTDGIAGAESGCAAILRILSVFVASFASDHEMAFLFLFEGRRIRGDEVVLSEGFQKFNEVVVALILRGQADGSLRSDIAPQVLASAMLGCAEGMIRDSLIAENLGQPSPFNPDVIGTVFEAMVCGLAAKR